jgi:hypothetical protein
LDQKKCLLAIFKRVGPLASVYSELNKELIRLCNFDVDQTEVHQLAIKCPKLAGMDLSHVIVPLQDSFTSRIPPMSSQILHSRPFPHALPTIKGSRGSIYLDETELCRLSTTNPCDAISSKTSQNRD